MLQRFLLCMHDEKELHSLAQVVSVRLNSSLENEPS